MRILQVHNYYLQSGGEDKVLEVEKNLLESHGHEVLQWTKSNKHLRFIQKLKLITSTHWSDESYKECVSFFKNNKFDIVHVHNFFPQFSPSIFKFFHDHRIPCVMTLHNYRLIYPNGFLFQYKIDHSTINGSAYNLITKKTYRNSYLQTAVVAHMIEYNRKHKTWHKYVDRFICLTHFQKKILSKAGLPASKMMVKPNFINLKSEKLDNVNTDEKYFIFVGRLSFEKGILQLLEVWKNLDIPYTLKVFGGGPLEQVVHEMTDNLSNVIFYGQKSNEKVLKHLANARALILPSLWYEGFPMTILEAYSLKVPVIATRIGGQNEIVQESITGCKYDMGNELELYECVKRIASDDGFYKKVSQNAFQKSTIEYSAEKNYHILLNIYKEAINSWD